VTGSRSVQAAKVFGKRESQFTDWKDLQKREAEVMGREIFTIHRTSREAAAMKLARGVNPG